MASGFRSLSRSQSLVEPAPNSSDRSTCPLCAAAIEPVLSSATSGSEFKMRRIRVYSESHETFRSPPLTYRTNCTSPVWAVVTTINHPTKALHQLAAMNVCTAVVGDAKTPPSFVSPGKTLLYLSADAQTRLDYVTADILPLNSFARKAIGYLYAIQHGATQLYDFDDDNWLLDPAGAMEQFDVNKHSFFELGNNDLNVNAYEFYAGMKSHPNIWPRGFPLPSIKNQSTFHTTPSGRQKQISVIQFLQEGNPDLDAIYRLTQPIPDRLGGESKQCIVIGSEGYTPYNAQATYFDSRAFFGLLMPMTVNGRVTDIWRSFIIQRIAKIDNELLAFCPSIVRHDRNPHSLIRDFNAEIPLYLQAHELVKFLSEMQRTGMDNLTALRKIYIAFYEHGVLKIDDVTFVNMWIHDLKRVTEFGAALNK
jgi:hypothetical protein